jgi:hypothetical protein
MLAAGCRVVCHSNIPNGKARVIGGALARLQRCCGQQSLDFLVGYAIFAAGFEVANLTSMDHS